MIGALHRCDTLGYKIKPCLWYGSNVIISVSLHDPQQGQAIQHIPDVFKTRRQVHRLDGDAHISSNFTAAVLNPLQVTRIRLP
jgi:hypothetical protein